MIGSVRSPQGSSQNNNHKLTLMQLPVPTWTTKNKLYKKAQVRIQKFQQL